MLTIVLLILCISATAKAGNCCKDNWIKHGNSCYLFIGTKETWLEAHQLCTMRGANLVSMETTEENSFVRGYLKVFAGFGANMSPWIGGNDMEIDGQWQWSPSGKPVTFTDWNPGEPAANGGDCMVMWHDFDYHWGDYPCHNQHSFICETPYV